MSLFSDFDWSLRGVRVRETGAEIRFSRALIHDVRRGLHYIGAERLRRRAEILPCEVIFHPRAPRPWYLLWGALRQAGLWPDGPGRQSGPKLDIHFSDSTFTDVPAPDGLHINGRCTDISKTRVATVFEAVFGYGLSLDPEAATEPFVEKGEANGVHDGRIHTAPCPAQPDRVYQRLIDNRTADGTVLDYRCPTVFGRPPLVFLKERPVDKRFENLNTRVRLADPRDCFSVVELSKIAAFCAAMHLDWGGLDILRDAADGRIYIVDVNKTDMGPPLALPIKEKLAAVKTLGRALREGVLERL